MCTLCMTTRIKYTYTHHTTPTQIFTHIFLTSTSKISKVTERSYFADFIEFEECSISAIAM